MPEREERHEAGDDDQRGEQHGAIDLADRVGDGGELAGEAAGRGHALERIPGRPSRPGRGQASEHVLDEDHGRVDDETEVDGADRKQVRGLAEQHQKHDREEEREGNGRGNDDRAAQTTQE